MVYIIALYGAIIYLYTVNQTMTDFLFWKIWQWQRIYITHIVVII